MSLDLRARTATHDLEGALVGRAPTSQDIARRGRARRRLRVGSVAAVTAAVLAGGLMVSTRTTTQPLPSPVVTPTASPTFGMGCQMPAVSCSDGRISVGLPIPMSFAPVARLDTDNIGIGVSNFQVRLAGRPSWTGMDVYVAPSPVDGTRDRPVAALLHADAHQVAEWLSTRPFLARTVPRPTALGGLVAWRVTATLDTNATLPTVMYDQPAAMTFNSGNGDGAESAASEQLRTTYYYLLDVPGRGLVVVWVWNRDGRQDDLDAMDAMVASLRFD